MKISIITICYNNEKDIRDTIESVVNQSYPDIEYIVVDGASKDSSLRIINEYKDKISKIISEPDKGIYDAINKGIKNATGDVVGLIHAGDRLYDNEVISKIASAFVEDATISATYGSSVTVKDGRVIGVNRCPQYNRMIVKLGWMPSHQSIYMKRELFDKYGYYRLDLGPSADYEWFIRFFYKYGQELKIHRIKDFILYFSMGGASTKSYKAKLKPNSSHNSVLIRSWKENGLKPMPLLPLIRLYWLIRVYIVAFFTNKKSI